MPINDINKIESKINYDTQTIDCLGTNKKNVKFLINNAITSTSNILSHRKQQVIIKDANKIKIGLIDIMFKNSKNKDIYLININVKQEKYIYKNHRNKYKYFNCSYNSNKDNFFLYLKKLLYQNNNRDSLLNEFKNTNIETILNFISYNLPLSNLNAEELYINYNLLNKLYKYQYKIKSDHILKLIIKKLIIPTFGISVTMPPKNNEEKVVEEKPPNVNIRKLAAEKMVNYFKNRNDYFNHKISYVEDDGLF